MIRVCIILPGNPGEPGSPGDPKIKIKRLF